MSCDIMYIKKGGDISEETIYSQRCIGAVVQILQKAAEEKPIAQVA